jgi:transposase-like protein
MKPIFHPCQRFPADVIRHAAWLYLRFTWNVRDIEDIPADRKQKVSNELIRRRILNFWPLISKNLRETRPRARSAEKLQTFWI